MEDNTICPNLLCILKRIYRDIVPTTRSLQETHLQDYDDVWKESQVYDKGQCYPQHVFYMATAKDLEDLQGGYLRHQKDNTKMDEFSRDEFSGNEFNLCEERRVQPEASEVSSAGVSSARAHAPLDHQREG